MLISTLGTYANEARCVNNDVRKDSPVGTQNLAEDVLNSAHTLLFLIFCANLGLGVFIYKPVSYKTVRYYQ